MKPKSGVVKVLGGGEYMIGDNHVKRLKGVPERVLIEYDWNNGKLAFLKNSQWRADELGLQISHGVEAVISFHGQWVSGHFVGNFFGDFTGDSFEGHFQSSYESYKSYPSTFVNGRITSFQRGVLGVAKLDVISLNKSSQKKWVSLLELQVGQYCNLTDENGLTHSFQVMKSCDNTSMDIELKEDTGQKRAIRIPWNEIRKSDDPAMFRRLSSIRIGGKPQIPYLFINDRVGAIVNIEVSTKPTMFGTTVDTYKLDTTLLRPITYPVKATTVHLFTPEEVVKFGEVYKDLMNNGMQLHLRNILDGIRYGVINGWSGYPHLKNLFGGIEGAPIKYPKYASSMEWLDEFVQIIVLRMVKSKTIGGTYVPNDGGRKIMFDRLSSMIRKAMAEVAPATNPSATNANPANPVAPAPPSRPSMVPEAFDIIDRALKRGLEQNGH